MFAVLEILPKNPSRLAHLRERLRPPELFLEQQAPTGAAPFYIIRAQERNDGIPWDSIAHTAGRCKTRMILPANLTPPPDCGIQEFVPERLPLQLLFNTACELLRLLAISPAALSCCLADRTGAAASQLHRLLPFARTLGVATENLRDYTALTAALFEDCGAAILVSDLPPRSPVTPPSVLRPPHESANLAGQSLFTLSLHSDIFSHRGFTLTYAKQSRPSIYSLGKLSAPPEFYLPPIEGISRFNILAALYELCDAKALSSICCETLFCNGRELSLPAAATQIKATFPVQ